MNYIVSEEELEKFVGKCWHESVKAFLKSKQPVEMIASGEVKPPNGSYTEFRIGKKGEPYDYSNDISLTGTYSKNHIGIKILNKMEVGKEYEIYIKECK
jgi:hypothetical protein